MNRTLSNFALIAGSAVVGAVIWALGDYYDVFFGHSHRSTWNVVENDTWTRLEHRALWGALFGIGLGLYIVIRSAWKRRSGKSNDDADEA